MTREPPIVIGHVSLYQAHIEHWVHLPVSQFGWEFNCDSQSGCVHFDNLVWPNILGL